LNDNTANGAYGILIAGANYTGMAMALAFAHVFGDEVPITLVDRRDLAATSLGSGPTPDPRCFALSAATRTLLTKLGVWDRVCRHTQDVREIVLTDSPLGAAVRPVLLRYENLLDRGEAASVIVPGPVLLDGLRAAASACTSIRIAPPGTIDAISQDADLVHLTLSDGRQLAGALLIAADGRASRVRELAGIKTTGCRYGQTGIVTTIRHAAPHHGCAVQHFLPGGPFALLPLAGGHHACITWSEDVDEAARILALDEAGFLGEIQRRAGGRHGEITLSGTRASFPLSTQIARQFIGPRLALVGDAAHGVHPIAGQGLNLAMRDVAALAQRISEARFVGLDIGDPTALEAFARWRRFDSTLSAGVFDGINRLFSRDGSLLRSLREAGLGAVDRLPGLKRQLVREAAGLSGDVPDLMRG